VTRLSFHPSAPHNKCWIVGLGGEASRPGRFASGETDPGTHWTRGWMGPRAGQNVVKREIFRICQESNHELISTFFARSLKNGANNGSQGLCMLTAGTENKRQQTSISSESCITAPLGVRLP
jgi:hypothetical protein